MVPEVVVELDGFHKAEMTHFDRQEFRSSRSFQMRRSLVRQNQLLNWTSRLSPKFTW